MAKPIVFGANPSNRSLDNSGRKGKFLNVQEQPNGMTKSHPFNNAANHALLLEYCKERMYAAKMVRDNLYNRYAYIDQQLSGFVKLSAEEQNAVRSNVKGNPVKPVSSSAQVTLTHLGRMVTFMASVFSPEGGMFEALATKDKQDLANALTEKMNDDSNKGRYFREYCKFFLNAFKYNISGMFVEWEETYGKAYKPSTNPEATGAEPVIQKIHAGNAAMSLPMYNTFWDPTANPCDVHCRGEFFAWAEALTPFQVKREVEAGKYFNTKDVLNGGPASSPNGNMYYMDVPQVRIDPVGFTGTNGQTGNGVMNWVNFFSSAYGSIMGYDGTSKVETLHMYIRLIPTEFGLVDPTDKTRQKIEIWKISIMNGQRIVATSMQNNMHDYLPAVFCMPNEDDLGIQVKSIGENLAPFQDLINFMMNSFVNSTRKNIWDLIIYDPAIVDLSSIGSDVAARVPMTPAGTGKDPSKSIFHFNKALETDKFLEQMQGIIQFMEWMSPTRMLQQVTDIDRAVKDQVIAAIASAQRESWKMAKLIDDQAFNPMRFIMYSNVVQYGGTLYLYDEESGTWKEFEAQALRGTRLEFRIGDGLKTVDKLSRQLACKEILSAILQAGLNEEFDLVSLIDYFSSTQGVEFDLTQFRKTDAQKQADAERVANAQMKAKMAAAQQPGQAPQVPAQ